MQRGSTLKTSTRRLFKSPRRRLLAVAALVALAGAVAATGLSLTACNRTEAATAASSGRSSCSASTAWITA